MPTNPISRYIQDIPDAHIDCVLYAAIAWFLFSQSYLSGDEAAKYISPLWKFWINYAIGSGGALTGAIKMFRSNTFAKHQEEKNNTSAATNNSPTPVP